jgi:hypothetical protein
MNKEDLKIKYEKMNKEALIEVIFQLKEENDFLHQEIENFSSWETWGGVI